MTMRRTRLRWRGASALTIAAVTMTARHRPSARTTSDLIAEPTNTIESGLVKHGEHSAWPRVTIRARRAEPRLRACRSLQDRTRHRARRDGGGVRGAAGGSREARGAEDDPGRAGEPGNAA